MKVNLKTIQLIKGLEYVSINRNYAIIKELQYTHIGVFFQCGHRYDITQLLTKQLPITNKYKRHLWEIAQWAQLGALVKLTLPNLRSNYIHRYIGGVQYNINLTYNYIMLRDMSNDTYKYVSFDSDTMYTLYAYHYEKQLFNLDMSILDIIENRKPSLKDRFCTWLKNILN